MCYSLMIAIGYYAQLGDLMFLGIFAPMFLLLVAFAYLSFTRREEFEAS